MMNRPVLYNYDLNEDCYRVRLLASCIGLAIELVGVDEYPGLEHMGPELLRLNPSGRLPILTDGDLTLRHTEAILLHLAMRHDPEQRFIPDDEGQRAMMQDWLMFLARDLGAARVARAQAMLGQDAAASVARAQARAGLRLMDDHLTRAGLGGQAFFVGAKASVADLALFPAFALSRDYNVDHDEFPALRLWSRRVRGLSGFVTMPGIPDYH
jgi:glutathione S-transferase